VVSGGWKGYSQNGKLRFFGALSGVDLREAVLPRNITTMLQGAAGHGNAGRGIMVNYHTHVSAIDTRGVSDLLREHGEQISTHFASEMRRRNM
jgi:hypothetical protein